MARLPDASRKAEEYAALGMFQEAAETAATVSLHLLLSSSYLSLSVRHDAVATLLHFRPWDRDHIYCAVWQGGQQA